MFKNIGDIGFPIRMLAYRLKISFVVKSIFRPHLDGSPDPTGVRQSLIYRIRAAKEIDSAPISPK